MNNTTYLVAPDSDIWLLKVPFEMDEENVLSFSNATAQYNYFSSLTKLSLEDTTYQRKEGVLRYSGLFDDLLPYNYCMYRNTGFSNKWFYAFVEDIKYINDGMTEIKLRTDTFQTWQFNITYHKMFVGREHVNDDTIGKNTVPEGLETGEFISNKSMVMSYFTNGSGGGASTFSYSDLKVVFGVTRDVYDFSIVQGGQYGNYSGLKYYAFGLTATTDINDFIQDYANNGHLEDLRCIFLAPSSILQTGTYNAVVNHTGAYTYTGKITLKHDVDGYTPKNNKLYVSPYTYLLVDNHAGGCIKINLEDLIVGNYFNTNAITFGVIGSLGVGCSFYLYPEQYKNNTGINRGLPYAKLPTLSWVGDTYTNWLTQTAINIPIGVGSALVGGALMLASGGTIGNGLVSTGLSTIAGQLRAQYDHQFEPASINGNISAVDCLAIDQRLEPTVYQMCVRQEFAKIIDDYFSAYGYQVNSYKIPNITGRTNWNYVKTSGCNITGDIPQKDLQELKNIFNKGVTIWHNASTFLDYSQSNGIVS